MNRVIGVLNAGSSSVKFSIFAVVGADLRRLYRAALKGSPPPPTSSSATRMRATVVDERTPGRGRNTGRCGAPDILLA